MFAAPTAGAAMTPTRSPNRLDLALAFASGGILTLMILCNGTVAGVTTGGFASLAAHGTGTVAALVLLAALPAARAPLAGVRVPWWAWLGGLAGATTVALGSVAMNSALALSGTIALGLAGQTAFGLAADAWGWFGLPRRRPDRRDALTAGLILAGCLVIIFGA
jgi:transporter family-2 protein